MLGTVVTFVAGAALGAYFGPQVRAAFAWAGEYISNIKFG